MKKTIAMICTFIMMLLLAACGRGEITVTETEAVTHDDELAALCLTEIINATDSEQVKKWLTEDSVGSAQMLLSFYEGKNVSVKTEYKTEYKGYDIFYYEARDVLSKEVVETGYTVLRHFGDKYLLCLDKALQASVRKVFMCDLCSGAGSVGGTEDTVCGICGGTGMQYMPSVYYDPATHMWMGQNIACSGCGGAGRFYGTSSVTCSGCNGQGLNFH